jgi:hypothetical protein
MAVLDNIDAMQLLGMVQKLAPNGEWQNEMAIAYNEACKLGQRKRGIIFLLDTLSDGLKYGNWPWVEYTRSEAVERERRFLPGGTDVDYI